MDYTTLSAEQRGRVGLITLNRPQHLNALNDALMDELAQVLIDYDANPDLGAIVITGSAKAFAAGADIAAMKNLDFITAHQQSFVSRNWETLRRVRKPVIGAVAGYALGGGCELAMMCDLLIAADNAKFGQPEIRLGIIPGAGGTQRLPRAIGKAKAMDLLLTARLMTAEEAERCGLVSRIVPAECLIEEALAVAEQISQFPVPVVMMIKEAVNYADEAFLSQGLQYERRTFHALFGTPDQKEGMQAFLDKRAANFPSMKTQESVQPE
jgi:enoyl-CoA hydratase